MHAPSAQGYKGTEYVLQAITRLEKDYEVEFVLVHDIPHSQTKEIYQRADIIIDQLLTGTYGVFTVEAMALGKPVVCYIREDLKSTYPADFHYFSKPG